KAPPSPHLPVHHSTWPEQSPLLPADAPAPGSSLPVPPLRETPARNRRPRPLPPPLGRETAESSASVLTARCLRPPIAITSLLFLTPSCNRISGEDLRQRGSSCASFRACASSTYSTLGGTLFWFSLHLSESKDVMPIGTQHRPGWEFSVRT